MNIIEELWYGNISPCERDFKRGSTYSELLGYIVRHEEDLKKRLNDEEIAILENFTECTNEMYGIAGGICKRFHTRSQDHHQSNEFRN